MGKLIAGTDHEGIKSIVGVEAVLFDGMSHPPMRRNSFRGAGLLRFLLGNLLDYKMDRVLLAGKME